MLPKIIVRVPRASARTNICVSVLFDANFNPRYIRGGGYYARDRMHRKRHGLRAANIITEIAEKIGRAKNSDELTSVFSRAYVRVVTRNGLRAQWFVLARARDVNGRVFRALFRTMISINNAGCARAGKSAIPINFHSD